MKPNRIVMLVSAVVGLVLLLSLGGNILENLDASDQMVIQSPSGSMTTFASPGWKPQWWGRVTKYHKRTNFNFLATDKDHGAAIPIRFNDAGNGWISGTIAYELPTDEATFLRLHALYGSQQAVERDLVQPAVTKAVYMTGPLMSSKESYADRRAEILALIDDQIKHGVYRTRSLQRREIDPLTKSERTVAFVEIVRDSFGVPLRSDRSPLEEFGIRTMNLSINRIPYSPEVENQIKTQQEMTMAVQTAMAEAKQAEQAALTAEQNGRAQAAKAKWDQEVIKATEVTAAEKALAVARLDVQTAEAEKRANILRGEGEAAAKQLIMNADGALDPKLKTWLESQKAWADAFANFQGQLVPGVVWGGGASGSPASGATQFMEIMGAQAARQLNLDMTIPSGKTVKK